MFVVRHIACWSVVLWSALTAGASVSAQSARPSLQDSFRLGSGGGVLCQVQSKSHDAALGSIFDRAWTIVCRDAARPVGKLYAVRNAAIASRMLEQARNADVSCGASSAADLPDLGRVELTPCQLKMAQVGYHVIAAARGKITYIAEGLAGYDSALNLALRTVIADKFVPGKVSVAIGAVDDPAAFARVQAGTLDLDQALAEGYRRNNSGNYAEAAEFFGILQSRALESGAAQSTDRKTEYLVNRALQASNLGEFEEADALMAQADQEPSADRVQTRLRRNFAVIHLINQSKYDAAIARLNEPVVPNAHDENSAANAIEIGAAVAAEINAGVPVGQRLGATESSALTPEERANFLDAQALQLRGSLARLTGKPNEARPFLEQAYGDVVKVREGRVLSVIRLRAQILAETGLALEDAGDVAGGEARLRAALALLETRYPQTVSVNGARARLAAYLARHGQEDAALALYKEVVATAVANREPTTGLSHLLNPYFDLLTKRSATQPALIDDLFLAAQTLVRPGVADTLATLGRQLAGGSGESARLFRQSQTLDRDIERSRIELANIMAIAKPSVDQLRAASALRVDLSEFTAQQTTTQAQLALFPQFRAISPNAVPLRDAQALLKPDEAYLKFTSVGDGLYAIYFTPISAQAWRVPLDAAHIADAVNALRDTISTQENGQQQTYPFDVAGSYTLFRALMSPVADQLARVRHILVEPDGGLLKLPPNLLVIDQASVDRYTSRVAEPASDQFDFTGVQWLGRDRAVSTMISVRGFRDARTGPPSKAANEYIGFGDNARITSAARAAIQPMGECDWPVSAWNRPIPATELRVAQEAIGARSSVVLTQSAFTDDAVIARPDLAQFRILHFATHGLVTAPKPQCHANPALLTSFGGAGSDGLLSFKEVYDLKLDADVIILSACDTASAAGLSATRAAGVTQGGTNALDGLVRAFIGAGGRTVLATHWPAPEDFHATEHLIGGLFKAPAGTSIGDALQSAQKALMDNAVTSHPYYWAGFAVVGDGTKPMLIAH